MGLIDLCSNNITSNMKRPTCGASRTTFYPFLELLYVCVVSSIVSLSDYRPYREGCCVSPSLPPTVTTKTALFRTGCLEKLNNRRYNANNTPNPDNNRSEL